MSATAFQRARREAAKKAPTSEKPADDLTALREEYTAAVGKKPFHGWDADTLTAKIAEARDGPHD